MDGSRRETLEERRRRILEEEREARELEEVAEDELDELEDRPGEEDDGVQLREVRGGVQRHKQTFGRPIVPMIYPQCPECGSCSRKQRGGWGRVRYYLCQDCGTRYDAIVLDPASIPGFHSSARQK